MNSPSPVPPHSSGPGHVLSMLTILILAYLLIAANLAMVSALGYFLVLALQDLPRLEDLAAIIEGALFSIVLTLVFFFLAKPFLYYESSALGGMFPIKESDAPEFFAFLRELCDKKTLSFPHEIYLCYGSFLPYTLPLSPLSLLFPKRERLLLGLAAVKALSREELRTSLVMALGGERGGLGPLPRFYKVARYFAVELLQYEDSAYRGVKAFFKSKLSFPVLLWPVSIAIWILRAPLILTGMLFYFIFKSSINAIDRDSLIEDLQGSGHDGMLSAFWKVPRIELGRQFTVQILTRLAQERRFSDNVLHHHQPCEQFLQSNVTRVLRFDPRRALLVANYSRAEGRRFSADDYQRYFDAREYGFFLALEEVADTLNLPAAPESEPVWPLFAEQAALLKQCSKSFYENLLGKPFSSSWTEAETLHEDFEQIFDERARHRHHARYGGFFDRSLRWEQLDSVLEEIKKDPDEAHIAQLKSALSLFPPSRCFELAEERETLEYQRRWYQSSTGPAAIDVGDQFYIGQTVVSRDAFLDQYQQASDALDAIFLEVDEALLRYLLTQARAEGCFEELAESCRFLVGVQGLMDTYQAADWLRDTIPLYGPELTLVTLQSEALMALIYEAWAAFEKVLKDADSLPLRTESEKDQSVADLIRLKGAPASLQLKDLPQPFFSEARPQLQHCWDKLREVQFESVAEILRFVDRLDPSLFPEEAASNTPTKKASEEA